MQKLLKPSEYAQMYGLSRQSVYAKIKRGILPSKRVDGRYYVIVTSESEPDTHPSEEKKIEPATLIDEYKEIIRAKDETIEVLKASIQDLKEANAQITQTLQQEIMLLKQAFHEMKTLYQNHAQLPHTQKKEIETESTTIDIEPEAEEVKSPKEEKCNKTTKKSQQTQISTSQEEDCWIPLGDLIQRQQYNYNKAKQVVKRFKKAYKRGDKRIKKENGIYFISCYDFYEDILE
jgi:hypothetical protein